VRGEMPHILTVAEFEHNNRKTLSLFCGNERISKAINYVSICTQKDLIFYVLFGSTLNAVLLQTADESHKNEVYRYAS
jgi:hypothetical protein